VTGNLPNLDRRLAHEFLFRAEPVGKRITPDGAAAFEQFIGTPSNLLMHTFELIHN